MPRLSIDVGYLRERLEALLAIPSPSGYTDAIVHHVSEELESLGLEVELTRRGAIRARMAGVERQPARGVVGHLDTLGAQVKALKPNGRLELVPIGHWSARFAEGARATLFSERGAYRGTILPLKASGHTFHEEVDNQPTGWRHVELRIDVWSYGVNDLKRLGIDVGDIVAIDPQPEFLENGFVVSRHLDDKAGAAVMLAAIKALAETGERLPADTFWLFTITEEIGHGASSILTQDIATMVTIDNGTTAAGQNSDEFGVTIAMADETGPFDWQLTRRLVDLCREHDIRFQKDIFRYYRSDSASAIVAGADVRTALACFGVDASHGNERIHMHALRSLAELITAYATSPIEIAGGTKSTAGRAGFTSQPMGQAAQCPAPGAEPGKH